MDERYDVVVVGGGAAGLSGALALARSRRSVLVVDAGEPRNAPADGVHNYLGREGAPPAELLADGRARWPATAGRSSPAGSWRRASEREDAGFVVAPGRRRARCRARRLLVTTGLVDELPDVPGVAERWGRDVLHCPYCHGWEVRDQAIGILGDRPDGACTRRCCSASSSDDVDAVPAHRPGARRRRARAAGRPRHPRW